MSDQNGKTKKGAHAVKKGTSKAANSTGKKKKGIPKGVYIFGGIIAALLIAFCAFIYLYPNVFPGVTVGAIKLGGQTAAQAENSIEANKEELYKNKVLSVKIYENTYDIATKDVIEDIDVEKTAQNVRAYGRTGNPFYRIFQVCKALVGKSDVTVETVVDESGLTKQIEDIVGKALTEPVEPTWEFGKDTMTIFAGKPGVKFDTAALEDTLYQKIRLMDFDEYEVGTELSEIPAIDIDAIAEKVIGDPVNATVSKEDGTTIVPEKPGVQFDIEKAREIIGDGSEQSYVIPITKVDVTVTAEMLKEVLFRDVLAKTSTSLSESNVPRTNNIRLASAAINGTILNPGDEFSYNGVVGERTADRGYQPAGAYSGGKIIEEFGGGVCQPSSTLYMAVLRADLEVVERRNHSFTVSYTPLGEDATVDYGTIDFRFKNNTDYPVKILAEQTNGQMIMTLVGTNVSGKTVETRTEVLATYSPTTIEKKDNSMMVGQTKLDQTGIVGYSTKTYQQVTVDGKTTEKLANESRYDKRDKIVYVGTIKPAPEPQPETPSTNGEGETEEPSQGETEGSTADPAA